MDTYINTLLTYIKFQSLYLNARFTMLYGSKYALNLIHRTINMMF